MSLQIPARLMGGLALLLVAAGANGQGTFQNLGFESANLPAVPPGQSGGLVSSLDAIPYWAGFLGTNQVAQVLHNDLTLGLANISILGPSWDLSEIFEGQYTVVLQPGRDPLDQSHNVGASISQTGVVPGDAQSLQFKASFWGNISITLGGQSLSITPLGTGNYYTLYGANIPLSAAGQAERLTITALSGQGSFFYFDSFRFSSVPTPEPGVAGLFALGALLAGWRRARRREQ